MSDGSQMNRAAGRLSERSLQMFVDGAVAGFAGWTVGYQVGFALRLPAYLDAAAGGLCALTAIVVLWRLSRRDVATDDNKPSHALLAVGLVLTAAVALAVLSTLMNRPDADDITFIHRAVAQLAHLGSPILTHDTTSDVASLPGPATGYLLTSYEFLCALLARGLGLNPLSMYQNGGGAFASALVPPVYYLLLRRLGLRPLIAVAGVGGVIAFLLLDGNDHHSMGNFAFVRLWQGKAILMTVLTPYMLRAVHDQLDAPSRRTWLLLLYSGVAATGLSTIGCFFAPGYLLVATLAVGLGLLVARACDWRTLIRRAVLLNLASAYPLMILLAILFVPFPGTVSPAEWSRAADASAFDLPVTSASIDSGWVHQLLWPASTAVRLVWALCLVALAPFLALPRKRALGIAMFVPAFAVLVANPLSGGLLVRAVPDVFWRFYFVLPIPLCFGLLVAGVIRVLPALLRSRRAVLTAGIAAVLLAVFIASVSLVTFSPGNVGFRWKSPTAWKLDEPTVAALGPMLPQLSGKTVLADQSAAVTLALMDPTITLVGQRSANTLTAFTSIGDRAEGVRRVRAQAVAGGLTDSPIYLKAFSQVLPENVNVVVVSTPARWLVEPLLARSVDGWRDIGGDDLLTVYTNAGE